MLLEVTCRHMMIQKFKTQQPKDLGLYLPSILR
jgi:hypothetical protein